MTRAREPRASSPRQVGQARCPPAWARRAAGRRHCGPPRARQAPPRRTARCVGAEESSSPRSTPRR
eukprot:6140301-Prymnesium_polylepis.1